MRYFRGHKKSVRGLAFSPDGGTLASAGVDRTVRLWDPAAGRERAALRGHDGYVLAVAFDPDGILVSGSGDRGPDKIRFWDPAAAVQLGTLPWPQGMVVCLSFTPDGRTLAASSRRAGGGGSIEGGTIRLWHQAGMRPGPDLVHRLGLDRGLPYRLRRDNFGVYCSAFSPDGRTLALGLTDRTLLVEWRAGVARAALPQPTRAWALAFSPGDSRLATLGARFVYLWDLSAPAECLTLAGHEKDVRAVAFSPDGRTLASAALDGAVILRDVPSGRERARLDWKLGPLYALAFSPDSLTLAAGGEGGIVLADVGDL